jgi:2,4-dienoyl-CoA reductase-like NADH-dependent reductase (Old Yellow Enzyme family)
LTKLRETITIRNITIKNRIVMAPMHCFSFKITDGYHTQQYIDHYIARAKGGAGIIITAATSVCPQVTHPGIWEDGQTPQMRQIVDGCHEYGAKVIVQIIQKSGDENSLTAGEIQFIQERFISAAKRVSASGADGLEIHCCHGSLMCRILSGETNLRTDNYGGTAENRARILTEMLPEMRKVVGNDFILSVRLGGNMPTIQDGIQFAKILNRTDIDILDVSSGNTSPTHQLPQDYHGSLISHLATLLKQHTNLPVVGVSEIFTANDANYFLENDMFDLVAVGRGMFADEKWATKALNGEIINQCHNCGKNRVHCHWFTDHTKCPARKKLTRS